LLLLLRPVDAVARHGADAGGLCFGIGKLDLPGSVAVFTRQAVLAFVVVTLDGVANEQRARPSGAIRNCRPRSIVTLKGLSRGLIASIMRTVSAAMSRPRD